MTNSTNYHPHDPEEPIVFTWWGEPIVIESTQDLIDAISGTTYGVLPTEVPASVRLGGSADQEVSGEGAGND